jgi:hypothetical protein
MNTDKRNNGVIGVHLWLEFDFFTGSQGRGSGWVRIALVAANNPAPVAVN